MAAQIVAVVLEKKPEDFGQNAYYHQMIAAPLLPQLAEELKDIVTNPKTLEGLNFNFLGIDLGIVPTFNVFKWETWNWANIGGWLLPVLSAGSQVVSMLIAQKMNNSVVTDDKGVQDKETAKNSQMNQSNKMMMFMMPAMSLWIGFTVPGALSL